MKFDNPKTGEECLDVLERSIILLGLGNLQHHEFWCVCVFLLSKKIKYRKHIPEIKFFVFFMNLRSLISVLYVLEAEKGFVSIMIDNTAGFLVITENTARSFLCLLS